jgi:hypothetical protein
MKSHLEELIALLKYLKIFRRLSQKTTNVKMIKRSRNCLVSLLLVRGHTRRVAWMQVEEEQGSICFEFTLI